GAARSAGRWSCLGLVGALVGLDERSAEMRFAVCETLQGVLGTPGFLFDQNLVLDIRVNSHAGLERVEVGFLETFLFVMKIDLAVFNQLNALTSGLTCRLDYDVLQPGLRVNVLPNVS